MQAAKRWCEAKAGPAARLMASLQLTVCHWPEGTSCT